MLLTDHRRPSIASREVRETAARHPRAGADLVRTAASLVALAIAVWVATVLEPSAIVHEVALFLHLAALVGGFGAVLAFDWLGLAWLRGRASLLEVLASGARLTSLIWLGLAGLVLTGVFLSPDPAAPRTAFKLLLVAMLTVNGHAARRLHADLTAAAPRPPRRLLVWAVASATVSQGCWWGASVIGFLNARA